MDSYDEQCCICLEIITYAKSLILLESKKCRHKFCQKCKNRHFQKNDYAECPICRKRLYKNDFTEKTADFIEFEIDKEKRKYVLEQIGQIQNQFDSISEFDDYLEQVEDIICNLKSENIEKQQQGLLMIQQWKDIINQKQKTKTTIPVLLNKQQQIKLPNILPLEKQERKQHKIEDKYLASGTQLNFHLKRSLQELLYFNIPII